MNPSIARKRLQQVLRVDAVNSSQSDFLATHVPFRNVVISKRENGVLSEDTMTEESIFNTIFACDDVSEKHQFIIVEGSSGAGKSHFIRWMYAKLNSNEEYTDSEKVLLIRRSDNTLKGTIKQLLEIEEVKNLKNKEVYERLVKANQTISEQKFKSEIYHKFIVEIDTDETETLRRTTRKKLKALLSNSNFEEKIMCAGGPIERIYNKIVSAENGENQDIIAQFSIEDFLLDTDFVDDMERKGADRNALKMANDLIPDDDNEKCREITDYMNSLVEAVIQSCAGIEPGDFQQIFKEIRQELRNQGKNLILLIEDITAFTGINQALLNALVTEHTGLYEADNLCRLISVVGTTTEYYRQFRDNYIDRVTTQITLKDGILGDEPDDLLQFVARYLNAMSLEPDVLDKWWSDGAQTKNLPVHEDENAIIWGAYRLSDTQILSLYPFTKNAVLNLYRNMKSHPTPRYILRDIVEPAVNEILHAPELFPYFCSNKHNMLPEESENRIRNTVELLPVSDNEKKQIFARVAALIGFWGNGKLNASKSYVGGINRKIFEELNLELFANAVNSNIVDNGIEIDESVTENSAESNDSISTNVSTVDPSMQKAQKEYDEFKMRVNDWSYEGHKLEGFQAVRDAICKFIFDTINWQQENIPLNAAKMIKDSSRTIISFDGQAQGQDRGILLLDNNQDSRDILLCFGKWVYLGKKSWNFKNSSDAIYIATVWLSKHKSDIVQKVKGNSGTYYPSYIESVMALEIYRKVLTGFISGKNLKSISTEEILSKTEITDNFVSAGNGHSKEWNDLINILYNGDFASELNENLRYFFKIVQGNTISSITYTLNSTLLRKVKEYLSVHNMDCAELRTEEDDAIKSKKDFWDMYSKITSKLGTAAKSEVVMAKAQYEKLVQYFGFDSQDLVDESDIISIKGEIKSFYDDAACVGLNVNYPHNLISTLEKNIKQIAKALKTLHKDFDGWSSLQILMEFSDDPMGIVKPFIDLLEVTEKDVTIITSQMSNEKESLIRKGKWKNEIDPRFDEACNDFNQIYSEFIGENNG